MDETGRRVTIPADVKRVVSLAPNLTETIYALGLRSGLRAIRIIATRHRLRN